MSNSKLGGLSKAMGKFSNNLYVKAISQGMMGLMPVTVVGSFIMIINNLLNLLQGTLAEPSTLIKSLTGYLGVGQNICMNFVSIIVVISISNVIAKELKVDSASSITLALISFFIVTPITKMFPVLEEGTKAVSVINTAYVGSQGMFVAIIVAILSTRVYAVIVNKGITIKMPDSVPTFVTKSFAQIVPFAIVIVGFTLIAALFSLTEAGNVHDIIYKYLQMPLQNLGSNIWAAMLLVFLAELLWFFGIHGSMVTSVFLTALFSANAYANAEAVAAGLDPTNIVNSFFIDCYKGPRAVALAVLLIWFCKSQHMKSVGKVAIVPSFFTITEPMKFGIPMVMNPWLLIPMSLSAPISLLIGYGATVIGFIEPVSVNLGRTLPMFVSGFATSGFAGLIVQLVQFVVICAMYIPFLKKLDNDAVAREAAPKAVAE